MAWISSEQVSVGGFSEQVSAEEMAQYLESRVGMVWRCRIKTSSTPSHALPLFSSPHSDDHCLRFSSSTLPPHAFVHFSTPDIAKEACKLAARKKLIIRNQPITARLTSHHSFPQQSPPQPPLSLSSVALELGTLIKPDEFLISWTAPRSGVSFQIDTAKKKCSFCFNMETLFELRDTKDHVWIKCEYKLEFLVRNIWSVKKEKEGRADDGLAMLLQLSVPPWIFYRTADDDIYHSTSFLLSDDGDPWIRTLDFTPDKSIGRCHTYRMTVSARRRAAFQKVLEFLQEHQVLDSVCYPNVKRPFEVKSVSQRANIFSLSPETGLPFEILFLVNALIHKGIVTMSSLTPSFFSLLTASTTQLEVILAALQHMLSYRNPVFDAEKRFKQVTNWLVNKKQSVLSNKLRDGNIEVRRFIITPSKAYCCAAAVEVSNRVLREYSMFADRFLRVSFLDENMQPLSAGTLSIPLAPIVRDMYPTILSSRTAVFKRVKGFLNNGFHLCGRKYSLLAFSANQLRDNSAWFFAELKDLNVEKIRSWMGIFPRHNVAKFAARMGQCFSSTYSTVEVPASKVDLIADIERNGYNFSDGIGTISPALADEVARALTLEHIRPSAYQIRYAGCKGVVAVWPSPSGSKLLSLRKSMKKFFSDHCILEVVSWTKFLPCYLNRQIITLLSTLEVNVSVFVKLQDSMVDRLCQILEKPEVAIEVLASSCSGDMHDTALQMLCAGFHPLCEPHLRDMLEAIRASQMEEILNKARIFVPEGRWLMGTLDELGILEYGQCFVRVSSQSYESLGEFTGSGNIKADFTVIKGKVVFAKNPCLHPGDIRILDAVDIPSLYHLIDCIVMPQKGNRPHPNEASGSDLDGDVYFVCWDARLIPPSGQSWDPMEYAATEINDLGRELRTTDLVDFFMKNMVNDKLGVISNAHVVHADLSKEGALNGKCIQLAKLAAMAVDFPKTGIPAVMPLDLKPERYPDFMDKPDKPSYKSENILGFLFRRVKGIAKKSVAEHQKQESQLAGYLSEDFYDLDLEVEGFEDFLSEAWDIKISYDNQLYALMGQFEVAREGDVVSGHFSSLSNYNSRRQGDIKDRIRSVYLALRRRTRELFEMSLLEDEFDQHEDEWERTLEKKASAWYHVTYHPNWLQKAAKEFGDDFNKCLLSFPWIAVDFLARIKARSLRAYESYHQIVLCSGNALDNDKKESTV